MDQLSDQELQLLADLCRLADPVRFPEAHSLYVKLVAEIGRRGMY